MSTLAALLPSDSLTLVAYVVGFAVFYGLVLSNWRQSFYDLSVKSWYASNVPGPDGAYLRIIGRRAGLLGWLLAAMGFDPTITMTVTAKQIRLHTVSVSGTSNRLTPLASVSSSSFGFYKPWFGAILVWLVCLPIFIALLLFMLRRIEVMDSRYDMVIAVLLGAALAFVVAEQYFRYNKSLTLGYVEVSGAVSQIRFMPSVIENVSIDEAQAKYAAEVMQHLIQVRLDK